jgi:NAD(P)-dependent dehydrogenase (short-subunit alcohol dehydrogenase family)
LNHRNALLTFEAMFSLAGKTALVSGAGSGIGAAIAQALAGAGARVLVTDRDADSGKATTDAIRQTGADAEFHLLDVTDQSACQALAADPPAREVGILVNNAGIGLVGTILQTSGADFDRLWAVNVRGVFNLCKAFVPGMIARKGGSIINIASVGGVVGIRDRIAYCTTKFAVVGLTKSLALDHAMDGIRANAICPGRVETPFVAARLKEYPDPEQAYREMCATQAIGRMGKPEEIAAAALYLASDEAALVTGSCLMTDGGWSAGK